jgi:hypothetical protein
MGGPVEFNHRIGVTTPYTWIPNVSAGPAAIDWVASNASPNAGKLAKERDRAWGDAEVDASAGRGVRVQDRLPQRTGAAVVQIGNGECAVSENRQPAQKEQRRNIDRETVFPDREHQISNFCRLDSTLVL